MNNQWTCGGGREGLAVDNQKTSSAVVMRQESIVPNGQHTRGKSRRSVLENKMLFLEFPGLSWGHDSLVMIASERLSLMKILLTHKQQARACKRSTQPTYQRPQILFIRSLCSCLSFFFISSVLFLFFSFCFGRLFCSVFFSFLFPLYSFLF